MFSYIPGSDFFFLGYIDPGSGFTITSLGAGVIASLLGLFGIFLLFFKKIVRLLKKHKKSGVILLSIIILGLTIIGVAMTKEGVKFNKKIVILGFDGLDPSIIESMMEEDKLPNFSRLKGQGSYSRLSTSNPSQSPVAWAGFATGKNPGENGIFDFIIRDPETYRLSLSLSNPEKRKTDRPIKSKCFWEYSSKAKVPTVIIGCPLTFPPYKVYGRMLSGMGVPDILGTEGTFSFYTTEPVDKNKFIEGKVFQIKRSRIMIMNLIGPKVAGFGGEARNTKIPFKVTLQENKNSVIIEYQGNAFELQPGQWSDWHEVTFRLGFFAKMKGVFKFYLVEISPGFKLYISPINFDPRKPYFDISYPKSYSKELADSIGLYHTQGMPIDTWAVNEMRLGEEPLLEQANEILREKTAMLEAELNRFEKGILFCYFGSSDIIQHMFWRYTDPQSPLYGKDASQEYKETIQNWYKKMDDILGKVLKTLGSDDTLIALSDHGFGSYRRSAHINSWLRKNGYLELLNPYAKSGSELLEDIDWPITKAYAIGFGGIYINQTGREKNGIVPPGKETELIKKELSEKINLWRDEKYDTPVINMVYSREEIFRGKYADKSPDLYLGFNIGYGASWQTALGGVPENLIEDNLKKWSGSHLFDPKFVQGVIFSNKKIEKKRPSIYDVSPTILKIIGFDKTALKKCGFDGEPLF